MNKLRSSLPLLITIIGFFSIGALAIYRVINIPHGPKQYISILAISIYILWKFIESRISIKESADSKENFDKGTVELCAVVEILLLISFFIGGGEINLILSIYGIIVMLMGISLRFLSIKTIKDNYTLRIRSIEGEPKYEGPYKIIRHPSYLSTLIAHTGITMVFYNTYSIILLLLWFVVVIIRTIVEDNFLLNEASYKDYSKKVKWRLFPLIF